MSEERVLFCPECTDVLLESELIDSENGQLCPYCGSNGPFEDALE